MSSATITYYPLSYNQRSMLYLHLLAPESDAYNTLFSARICSVLDVDALHGAFQALVDRHAVLRTTYTLHANEPVQQIHAYQPVAFTHVDAGTWHEDRLLAAVREVARRPFALATGPVLRVHLFTRAPADHVLLIVIHHIAIDMSSYVDLIEQLGVAYQAAVVAGRERTPATAVALPEQCYTAYVDWQQKLLTSAQGEALRAYWQTQLAGELPILDLPTDRPLPPVQQYHGASHNFTVSQTLLQQLKRLAKAEGTSVFTVLLAAFQVLLYRYSGQEELLTGVLVSARNRGEFQGMPGYCINPIAIRSRLNDNPSFKVFLAQVRHTLKAALQHQDYPFALLIEQLQLQRDASRPPLFQATFNMLDARFHRGMADFFLPAEQPVALHCGGLELEPFFVPQQEGGHFLAVELYETGDMLRGFLKYNADLFDAATIARLSGHYQTLLESIVANASLGAEQPIAALPLLTPTEREQLLVAWNATATPYVSAQAVHQRFEAQVARTPARVAVVFGGDQSMATNLPSLTYAELNARANQLAHHLCKLGVGPEVRVGICVERSLDMLVGLLGILKAGGAYVPLDPAFPQERLAFMLEDAQPLVLLTQKRCIGNLPLISPAIENRKSKIVNPHMVCLDADWATIAQASEENTGIAVKPEQLAYVLYTSGSTGRPKGVQIEHGALTNFLQSMQQQPGLNEQDVLLAVTTISFDIAGLELYLPLITGAKIVLADRAVATDGIQLLQLLNQYGATLMQATPATWRMLLAAGWAGSPQLKMLCGGEALSQPLADQLLAKGAALWNMYGPTETTIWSAMHQVQANRPPTDAAVPIGGGPLGAIANTQLYILDAQRQPVPIGVPGELYIGGDGLARGYLNRSELTAEKFVLLDDWGLTLDEQGVSPQARQAKSQPLRLYRTGDLARYRPDGVIEFLGRIDNQVKVQGFRIELGEIEAVLNQHPAVAESVVVVRADQAGDKQVVAYVVADKEQGAKDQGTSQLATRESQLGALPATLRDFLKTKLPGYMIPAAFVLVDEFPLTPNGKVDRRALPAPEAVRPTVVDQPLQSMTEETLAAIWKEILGIPQIGRTDNFFDLGGHSLRATHLLYRVQATFAVTLSLQQLFAAPTVAGMARLIECNRQTQAVATGVKGMTVPARAAPCLVALKSAPRGRPTRSPFFCIHPLGGVVFPYYELALRLDAQQPFYGLQAVGITDAEPPLTQIGAMAARYIAAVRLIQPDGPYYLGGWSFGAYVAYEMARQLQQAGQAIALLTIIDTPSPSDNKLIDTVNWSDFFLTAALPSLMPYVQDYFQSRKATTRSVTNRQWAQWLNHWPWIRALISGANGSPKTAPISDYPMADIFRLVQIMLINVQAAIDYAPQPYAGRITLLRTGQSFGRTGQTPDLGWRALATAGVEIYRIPGQHMDVLRAPHVQVLAGQLQRSIEATVARQKERSA